MAAAANRSGGGGGAAAQCHRAGPGPGPGGPQQQQGDEERRKRRRQQQAPGLGLVAPCIVKQEEEDEVVKVEVQQEEEEQGKQRAQAVLPDCPPYPPAPAQARSGASCRERQQFSEKRRILIVDEQQQRVEEAVLCQEVEWDRGVVWQRSEDWSQDVEEPGKVVVSVASLRGREQRPQRALQALARDRPGAAPAQRRRKSEYPRRRSCISFTFSGAEPTGGRPEEGEEPMENRDLQRFDAAHRENGEAPASRQDLRTCGEALGELVGWTHRHCQGCLHPPRLRYLPPGSTTVAVWACQAGHTYRWHAAGRSPRRRGRHRAAKSSEPPTGASESQETERGPSSEREEARETERGLSSEEEEEEDGEEESDGGCASNPITSLRIVECELEEQGQGGRGPQPGWKVIPCKDERSEEEEAEEGLDPIEPLPEPPGAEDSPRGFDEDKARPRAMESQKRMRGARTRRHPGAAVGAALLGDGITFHIPCTRNSHAVVNSRDLAREQTADTEPDMETETMQLICKSVSDADPKDESISLAGLAAAAGLPDSIRDPELENSEEEEPELVETDDDVPFHDDPKDEMYEPSPHRERGKPRRRPRKEKEKLETVEKVEPPKRRPRRSKEDRGPRPPKKRKKPPIQYVRCEMEGCGTILANPRYLQHHMRYQHMLKKKYVCPHPSCGRLFRLQKQLLRHTKHHSDQRDYICEYCARAFKSSHNLAVHRMIHTGEKPLQCEICGFTCRQKASLNWHMKKHDADANYQFSCNVCGKKFEKKDSVVAHKSKSHPELVIAAALAESAVLDPPTTT